EAAAELVHVETVEELGRLAHAEVARRPRARARQVPREEPLGRPRAEAPQRHDAGPHLVVVEPREPAEVDLGAGEPDHVLRLAAREAERDELGLVRTRNALPRGECVRDAAALAEALDQPRPDRERG